jgi:hypothetical protein
MWGIAGKFIDSSLQNLPNSEKGARGKSTTTPPAGINLFVIKSITDAPLAVAHHSSTASFISLCWLLFWRIVFQQSTPPLSTSPYTSFNHSSAG